MTKFGALTWGWRIRWPNIVHVFLMWYGAIWLAAESLSSLDRDRYAFLQAPETLWLAVAISLIAALWRNRFHTQVTFRLPTTNTEIEIKFQDVFLEPGMRLIPVNEFFDGQLGAHVSPTSLHGQFIAREFQADTRQFNADITNALSGVPGDFVSRTTGNTMRYDIGTTAQLMRGADTYLLFALSRTDVNTLEASSDLPTFIKALEATWKAVRTEHNGSPVVVPLTGTGLSRIGLPPKQMLDLLLLTFLAASRERQVCLRLIVTLLPDTFREHNLLNTVEAWRG